MPRAALLALLLLAPALAGCAGDAAPSPPTAAPPGPATDAVEAPEETMADAPGNGSGASEHAHDSWAGRERATFVEGEVRMLRAEEGVRGLVHLPRGVLVREGTGALAFAFSEPARRVCVEGVSGDASDCTDPSTPSVPVAEPAGFRLLVRHAAAGAFDDAGEVAWSAPTTYALRDPRHADMPHSARSLWGFEVRSADPAHEGIAFRLKVEMLRAPGEIPRWPGHPAFYAEGSVRRVLDAEGADAHPGPEASLDPAFSPGSLRAAELVSHGTRALHVFANVTSVEMGPGTDVRGWTLHVGNATGEVASTRLDDAHGGDRRALTWVLPVDGGGLDSPYAEESRWSFALRPVMDAASGPVMQCHCFAHEVRYHLVVLASSEPAPAYDRLA